MHLIALENVVRKPSIGSTRASLSFRHSVLHQVLLIKNVMVQLGGVIFRDSQFLF